MNSELDDRSSAILTGIFNFSDTLLVEDPIKDAAVKLNTGVITPELYNLLANQSSYFELYQRITNVAIPAVGGLLNLTFFPSLYKKVIELPNKRVSRYL